MLLVGALIIAAVTAVMAKNMFSGAGAPQAVGQPAVPAGPEVLVATRALPVGTIIDAEAFRYQPWPQGLVQPAYYIKGKPGADPADLIGTVVRNEITAGQPVTQGALIKPGERGFLAAALGPGHARRHRRRLRDQRRRRLRLPGRPGRPRPHPGGRGRRRRRAAQGSETILRNIRVLAIDQRINARDEDGNQVAQTVSTVTLEATPKIAEKIAVAQTIGQLSLSLRSLADNNAELERAIASGEVHGAGERRSARRAAMLLADRQPADRHQPDLHGRLRRLPLPAQHRARQGRATSNNAPWQRPRPPPRGATVDAADGPGRPRRPRQQCHARSGGSQVR